MIQAARQQNETTPVSTIAKGFDDVETVFGFWLKRYTGGLSSLTEPLYH